MVDRDPFYNRLEQHRFSGARGSDYESALAITDRRNEVDGAASQLGSTLRRTTRLELQFALGIRRDQRSEIGTARCFRRVDAVDLQDIYDDYAIPVIVTGRRQNFVTAAQHVLPHDLRRHVRIARLGEVAVRRPADEAAFALWVEPARSFSIRDHWSERCALSLIAAWPALLLLLVAATSTAAATTTSALSAASALIASATSVMTVIAIAVLALIALLSAILSLSAALAGLRIVLRLLL